MELKLLFKDIPDITWKGNKDIEITGITAHSKTVAPGNLFLVKRDGRRFMSEAVLGGAAAILTDTYDPFITITQIIHPLVHELEFILAQRFYQNPMENLKIFGITGTNGKTTTAFIIQYFLGRACGLIGTVKYMTGKRILPSSLTTPDFLTLSSLFNEMKQAHCPSVVMEVSSHALDQDRVKNIPFSVGIFTNFNQDHLDYHGTLENYAAAKSKLFSSLDLSSYAIVNGDDAAYTRMIQGCTSKIITYGFSPQWDLYASDLKLSSSGMTFNTSWKGEKVLFKTSLIGRFNVYNILAATAAVLTQDISLREIAQRLEGFSGVPGRLERVENSKNLKVFVDYSHKPEALKNVLLTLRELSPSRIITVFGCGGNRDVGKRPQMAAIAETYSDLAIVTNDNPRNEDPVEIASQIIQGFKDRSKYKVELDRRKAISDALEIAKPTDIVLIAGKGHESYQILGSQTISFDDREVVREF